MPPSRASLAPPASGPHPGPPAPIAPGPHAAPRASPTTLLALSPAYPASLRDLPDPPEALRVLGALPPLAGAVAIVGTRYADDDGLDLAHRLAADLAAAGRTVVSGGARGVDAAAHRGALDAGGRTVVVLGTGVGRPYPPEHRGLFDAIVAAGGALLSEAPDDALPHRGRFLRRNRLVAALGAVLVVVQAPARSGALSPAAWARRLGRDVHACPASPSDPRGAGCLALLRQGARICTSAADVLSTSPARGSAGAPAAPFATDFANLSDDFDADIARLLRILGPRGRTADELGAAAGLPVARTLTGLFALRLRGAVEEHAGRYRRVRSPP
jgi:DNA processing protein